MFVAPAYGRWQGTPPWRGIHPLHSVEESKREQDLGTAHRSLPPPLRDEPAGAWGIRLSQRTLVAQILCESHRHSQRMLLSNGESAIELGCSSGELFRLH